MDLDGLLMRISGLGASDVHLKLGQPPVVRRDGLIEAVEGEPALTEEALEQIVESITRSAPERQQLFMSSGELDIGYECARHALPGQRLQAARRDLGRLPRDPA